MAEIKISVIVPVHGVAGYIEKCLVSLAEQDFDLPYEVICVNDSPNDNSPLIIEKFCKAFPHKFYSHTVGFKNVSDARNYGFNFSHGEYVCFVDGDDFVGKTYLKDFYYTATKNNYDVTSCSYRIYEEGKFSVPVEYKKGSLKKIEGKKALKRMLSSAGIHGYVWNRFYKRDLIKDITFISTNKVIEDITFNALALLLAKNVGFIKKRNYNYVNRVSHEEKKNIQAEFQTMINSLAVIKGYCVKKQRTTYFMLPYRNRKKYMKEELENCDLPKNLKKELYEQAKSQLKCIKNDFAYKNTPWQKLFEELGLNYPTETVKVSFKDLRDLK